MTYSMQWCSGGGATGAIVPVPGSLLPRQFCLHLTEIRLLIQLLLVNYLVIRSYAFNSVP